MTNLASHLQPGEEILWTGVPAQGLLLTSRDWLLIPFGLAWGGFAMFWESAALRQTSKAPFLALWGVPFVLAWLYVIAGRFLLDAWVRRGISYALTNRRILIERSAPFSKFTAIALDQLPETSLSERADGFGSILFGDQVSMWNSRSGFASWTPSLDPTPQFIMVKDARRVFDRIESARRTGR